MQKGVDGANALFDAACQPRPFPPRNDPRHKVKGDQPFIGFGLSIDVEGDASTAEKPFRIGRFLAQIAQIFAMKPRAVATIGRALVAAGLLHFVEEAGCVAHVVLITDLALMGADRAGKNQTIPRLSHRMACT